MQAKTIRNIIIALLLVFIGVFVVYCTNTKDSKTEQATSNTKKNDNQEIRTEAIIESQHNKQDNTQIDAEIQKESTNKIDSQIQPTETKETISNENPNIKDIQNTQINNTKSHDKMQTKKSKDKHTILNHTTKKQDKKNPNKADDTREKADDIREKEKDAVGQTNDVIKNNTQQKNLESNQNKQSQDIQTLMQDNKNSKENKQNNAVNGTDTASNNTSKANEAEEKQDSESIHTNNGNSAKEQEKQDKNNIENAKSSENDDNKTEQNNTEFSKDEATNDSQNQTNTDKQTGACIVAPSCDNPDISRQLATTSLDLHANMRAKEEAQVKGQSAGEEFIRLWNQTRNTILPKLTSHVSNIYDQGTQEEGKSRTCVANYYTEVLEDFGNGWKDKKGDKSPIYKVKYNVSCKNLDTAKLTILEESKQNSKQVSQTLIRQDNKEVQQGRIPPACNDTAVHNQLAEAGLYAHAMARAQEEGRTRGQAAQQKFMQLWDKTQSQVITKLTAHVSNIRDQGIQANKQIRTCVANYYTKVLEDFGHGWKDKKGDKSPLYIVYYSVAYVNNEDDVIKIKITAQNRIK